MRFTVPENPLTLVRVRTEFTRPPAGSQPPVPQVIRIVEGLAAIVNVPLIVTVSVTE